MDLPGEERFSVFPNPARDAVNVYSSAPINHAAVIIYDLAGREVILDALEGSQKQIDLGNIPDGVYWMRIIESSKSYTLKFVKGR
jgi:hypothetical protein